MNQTITTIKIHRKKVVSTAEILFLKGEINYTKIHFASGQIILLAKTLKKFEEDFSSLGFFRINKTNIINLGKIISMFDDFSYVVLDNNVELTVSRRRRTKFRSSVKCFKEKLLRSGVSQQ